MNSTRDIINIKSVPERLEEAANWFHDKWEIPVQAYLDSMRSGLVSNTGVPAWYVMIGRDQKIIAGLGVIENDFHKRHDLTPNICAVYVETDYRHQGIARCMLDHACHELAQHGIRDVYLVTDHTELYEHCGWSFYGKIEEDEGNMTRCYYRKTF